MPRLLLVRHGRAAAGWAEHDDPGLDETGRAQAVAVAASLDARGPLPIVSSPLLRARETAQPLEAAWGCIAQVDPTVGEIPSPGVVFEERATWLRTVLAGNWSDVDAGLAAWRDILVAELARSTTDAVVFTHFVAINAAVGAATGDDRVVVFAPDSCSVTELATTDGRLEVVSLGGEAATAVR